MLAKISEKAHEVNKTLLWEESPGSTHRMERNGQARITGLMRRLLQPARWQMTRILTVEVAAELDKREWRQSTKKALPMTGDKLGGGGGWGCRQGQSGCFDAGRSRYSEK